MCRNGETIVLSGLTSIHELLAIDESMAELILRNAEAGRLRAAAIEAGMATLRQDGMDKILRQITTIEEVIRATAV